MKRSRTLSVLLFCLKECSRPTRLFWSAIALAPIGYILGAVIATSAPALTIGWLVSKSQHDVVSFAGYVMLYALPLLISVFCLRSSEVVLAHLKTQVRRGIEIRMLGTLLDHTLNTSQYMGKPINVQKMVASLNGVCDLLILTVPSVVVRSIVVVIVLELFSVTPPVINAVMLLLGVVTIAISTFGAARQYPLSKRTNSRENAITDHYTLTYNAHEVACTNPAFHIARHGKLIDAWDDAKKHSLRWAIINTSFVQAWANSMLIVLFVLVVTCVARGAMTAPVGLLVFAYVVQLRSSVDAIGGVLYGLQENLAAASAMHEFLLKEPELVDGIEHAVQGGGLSANGVTVAYLDHETGQEREALTNFIQKFGPGRLTGIVGAIGAGKSSLLRALMKIDRFTGTIMFGDSDIRLLSRACITSRCAYAPQRTVIDSTIAVGDYIRYGLPISQETVGLAASLTGIDTVIAKHGGFDATGASAWSVGEQLLLSITRAFAWCIHNRSDFLLMDEPSSALDAKLEAQLQSGIVRLMELLPELSVLIVAHRLSTIQNADTILVMEQGNAVEQGTHQELITQAGRYAEMCAAQTLA